MRTLALALFIVGTVGCNSANTPTAPTLPAVAPVPSGAQSSCAPPTTGRVYSVPVPGHTAPLLLWVDAITPTPGATVRVGDTYRVTYRQRAPEGIGSTVRFDVGTGPGTRLAWSLAQGSNGCGQGTYASQVTMGVGGPALRVRVWVRPPGSAPGAPLSPTDPADFESSEPLDWTIVP